MLASIGGFFGSLFGTKKAGEKIVEGITDGIDKIWYTKEEKSEDAAKARTEGMAVYMSWLESTSGSRLARRSLALIVTGIWSLEHISSVVLKTMAVFADPVGNVIDGVLIASQQAQLTEAALGLSQSATENNTLVGVVLLFYFGGPVAMQGVGGMVNRWVAKGGGKV